MSIVSNLIKSRNNTSVKLLEFMRIVAKENLPVCFEGEDEKYYSVRISNFISVDWIGIDCGGKENVIALRKSIKKNEAYKDTKALFFVDSDFDNNTHLKSNSDIYITPCYSVENLYISDEAFQRILRSEFGISEMGEFSQCYQKCIQVFNNRKQEFLNAIKEFNYLIFLLRQKEKDGTLKTRLNINNIEISSLVSIGLDKVDKLYDVSLPKNFFSELPEDLSIDINSAIPHFVGKDAEIWYRGKQNLEFLRVFLTLLRQDKGKKENREIFQNRSSVKLQLTKPNAISELSQYANTPTCLKEFLQIHENSFAA
ncbi:DUF4435 domain-containing protein [Acinetobacter sp. SA01]|uniref:DUF4435 domain-containing protein n=1 Tax=Acinetobacter sp. SA01 TaxID=1862567 RepID=UPI00140C70B9